jgi:ribosomal protein S6--L-glutamate ligase
LEAAGKETFPSAFNYHVRKSRLAQEVLFQFLECAHPRTRVFYGRQKNGIAGYFLPPFLAMGPRMSDGVRLVRRGYDLPTLLELYNPLIIREIVEYKERFVLVFVNFECVAILKRAVGRAGERSPECAATATVPQLENVEVPERFSVEIVSELEKLLRSVKLNDIAVEIGITGQGRHLMEFARSPLSWPSHEGVIDRFGCICRLVESGRL